MVLLDSYSTWILRLARPRSCRCIGIVKEKDNFECQFFDLRYSFQTKLLVTWSSAFTTSWPNGSHCFVLFSSYTNEALFIFSGRVITTYVRNVCTQQNIGLLILTNIFFVEWQQTVAVLICISSLPNTSIFSNRNIMFFYFLSLCSLSIYTSCISDIIKTQGQQLFLKTVNSTFKEHSVSHCI